MKVKGIQRLKISTKINLVCNKKLKFLFQYLAIKKNFNLRLIKSQMLERLKVRNRSFIENKRFESLVFKNPQILKRSPTLIFLLLNIIILHKILN